MTKKDDRTLSTSGRALRTLQIGSVIGPLVAFAAWGGWSWYVQRTMAVELAETNVELAAQYAHRVIESQQSLLNEVADIVRDQDLETVDQQELHQQLARLVRHFPFTLSVGVVSAEGRVIVSSFSHPIEVSVTDRAYFQALREDGANEPFLERVMEMRPSGREAIVVAVRNPADGFNGILGASIHIEALTNFFGQIVRDERASASLMREDGMLLVRHTPEAPATSLEGAPIMAAIERGDRGTYEALAITDNIERLYAFARVGDFPLFANFGTPKAAMFEHWLRDMAPVAVLLALAAILGLVGSTQASRRLAVEEVRQRADFNRQLFEEAQKTAEMRQAVLREIHHRTKNSLQMVQSLINRGKNRKEIEQRIWAIARIHDLLHAAQDFQTIDLGQFLQTACANPALVPPELRLVVRCEVDRVEVDVNSAIPLALAAVELLTNATKHAFPDGRRGTIKVELHGDEKTAWLVVEDDGIGMPENAPHSSGLRLVRGFVDQVGSNLKVTVDGGTRFAIEFPMSPIDANERVREEQAGPSADVMTHR